MIISENKKKICNLEIHTVKKDIKHLHLGVYPPDGRVRIAAPTKTSDETLRVLVTSKMPWIKKQKAKFEKQDRQPKREFVSGKSHYFMGNRYLLNVVDTNTSPKVEIKRKAQIDMYVKPKTSGEKRERIMDNFYRSELRKKIPILGEKWEKITKIHAREFRIKKMKTKWRTCSQKPKRIWINLELAKKPLHCLDYIIVHEMTHLVEKNHTTKFRRLMDSFMPQWVQYKEELNRGTLGYSKWRETTA
jgi:predicted metal-dependent hydrolase